MNCGNESESESLNYLWYYKKREGRIGKNMHNDYFFRHRHLPI